MLKVISKDGTPIAYEVSGAGPPVVLIDGALCYHDSGPGRNIAKLLSQNFTTYLYDRRGRGESGDMQPYAVEREIEDLEAMIHVAGGSAYVFGQSSGAVLALEAAERLGPMAITKLAVYEAPLITNNDRFALGRKDLQHMQKLVYEGRRSDAISFFFKSIELPDLFSIFLRITPLWSRMKSIAPTLVHDFAITTPYQTGVPLPKDMWQHITMPTWVGAGGKSPHWMQHSEIMLAQLLPNARYHLLPDQTHNLKAAKLVPVLSAFFKEQS